MKQRFAVAACATLFAQARLRAESVESVGSTPRHLAELIRADLARWAPLVKESGARTE